jgi:hypothetical protein
VKSLAFILSVNHVRRISAEYHPSLAFVGIGSTLSPLLANILYRQRNSERRKLKYIGGEG